MAATISQILRAVAWQVITALRERWDQTSTSAQLVTSVLSIVQSQCFAQAAGIKMRLDSLPAKYVHLAIIVTTVMVWLSSMTV